MNIHRIFEYMNGCAGTTELFIWEDRVVTNNGGASISKKELNEQSIRNLQQILQDWSYFQSCDRRWQAEIIQETENWIGTSVILTAEKVRNVYKKVISGNYGHKTLLDQFQKIACDFALHDRVVVKPNSGEPTVVVQNCYFSTWWNSTYLQNQQTIRDFQNALYQEWGKNRVDRVLYRYEWSFPSMIQDGEPLTVDVVRKIFLGLGDLFKEDVQESYERMMDWAFGHETTSLPLYELHNLQSFLGIQELEELKQELIRRFAVADRDLKNLSVENFNFIVDVIRIPEGLLDLIFSGERIEGVISGHQDLNCLQMWYARDQDVQERLQLHQKIRTLSQSVPPELLDYAYDEILAKGHVKKEMEIGLLVPTPDGQWYFVEDRIVTGRAKLAYHLTPGTFENCELPDRLVYRSTAMNPSFVDSFTSIVTDGNPFNPPGYLWSGAGLEKELEIIMTNVRNLKIVGHSLGASFGQLAIVNLLRYLEENQLPFPNKNITLASFDAPAITLSDCSYFANWAKTHEEAKRINLEYHISQEDYVSGCGQTHLGYGTEGSGVAVRFHLLDTVDPNLPELKLHPHGRFYYLTELEKHFSIVREGLKHLEAFDLEAWRWKIEIGRKIAGFLVVPIVGGIGFAKRFLIAGHRASPMSGMIRILFWHTEKELQKQIVSASSYLTAAKVICIESA